MCSPAARSNLIQGFTIRFLRLYPRFLQKGFTYLDLPLVRPHSVGLLELVQTQGGLAVRGGHEGVHGEAAEQRRLADAVLAAQDHLLAGHLDCGHPGRPADPGSRRGRTRRGKSRTQPESSFEYSCTVSTDCPKQAGASR